MIYACSEEGVAVVPYGGGTSVVGGLEPLRGRFGALISLDLGRLEGLGRSTSARTPPGCGGGTRLPEADHALAERGFTLAHTPQSYEWATVGGCVATRSAGQSSTGYGRIDDNVVAVRCATPAGELATLAVPATAAGPSLKQLVIGSEGTLGVITSVGLRVFPRPAAQRYEGWFVRSFAEGADVLRRLVQAGIEPDVARLSDEAETAMGRALGGGGRAQGPRGPRAAARARLRERLPADLRLGGRRRRDRAPPRAPRRGCCGGPARCRWGRARGAAGSPSRYAGPHLRDDLLDRGVLVETLETATTWSNLETLKTAVTRALEGALAAPLVLCHVSHLYATGASLYFTALAAQDAEDPGRPVAGGEARRDRRDRCDRRHDLPPPRRRRRPCGLAAGGAGRLGHDVLRVVKERCDPAGVMNPGKLLG